MEVFLFTVLEKFLKIPDRGRSFRIKRQAKHTALLFSS
jgi:hypothetical protein